MDSEASTAQTGCLGRDRLGRANFLAGPFGFRSACNEKRKRYRVVNRQREHPYPCLPKEEARYSCSKAVGDEVLRITAVSDQTSAAAQPTIVQPKRTLRATIPSRL